MFGKMTKKDLEKENVELKCQIIAIQEYISRLELENAKLKCDFDTMTQLLWLYWEWCAYPVYKEIVDQPKIPMYYADDLHTASDMEALSDRVRLERVPYVFLIKS